MTFTSLRETLNYYLWWHQGFILILLEKIVWNPFLALLSTYFESPEFPTLRWKRSHLLCGRGEIMFDFFYSLENIGNKNFLFATSTWYHPLSRSVSETMVSSLPGEWAGHTLLLQQLLHSWPQHDFAKCKGGWLRLDIALCSRDGFCLFWFSLF